MKLWFLQVVSTKSKHAALLAPLHSPGQASGWLCPALPSSLMYTTFILLQCLLHSSMPGQRGPWGWSSRSCICKKKTDMQIVPNKLQKMPSPSLCFEFSSQTLHIVPFTFTMDGAEQASVRSHALMLSPEYLWKHL